MTDSKTLWFVGSCYTAAGRPKAEEAVMRYAVDKYRDSLIFDDKLDSVILDLKDKAAQIREENKRLAPVDISLSKPFFSADLTRWIRVGAQRLILRMVRTVIE